MNLTPPRLTGLLLAAAIALPSAASLAVAPVACPLPTTTSAKAGTTTCGLDLIGSVTVSSRAGLGQVAVHDDLAAVVERDDGTVALVNLSDRTAPTVLGRYDGGTGQAALDDPFDGDVVFSDDGTTLFYARQTHDSSNEGLHVLDVTDPAAPVLTDVSLQGGMLRVAYARLGDTEVVVTQDAIVGLTIFEVLRTPLGAKLLPVHVDALPALKVGGPASAGIQIVAEDPALGVPLLYVTDGTTGLRILSLADPRNPVELGAWPTEGLAGIAVEHIDGRRLVHAAREYWFTATTPPELLTLDASDLGAITVAARRNLGGYDGALAWKLGGLELGPDRSLHVAQGHAGVMTLDLGSGAVTAAATALGAPHVPSPSYGFLGWYAMDVLRDGDQLLVTDAITGDLRIFTERG